MPNSSILLANLSAALDEAPLPGELTSRLTDYAAETASSYCRRCGKCATATVEKIPIPRILEMLMYARKYGLADKVAHMFAQLPHDVRDRLHRCDYARAEKICPQNIPIAHLMAQASVELPSGVPGRSHNNVG